MGISAPAPHNCVIAWPGLNVGQGTGAVVTKEELDAAIRKRTAETDFAAVLSLEGVAVVAIDDDGHLIRLDPRDGSETRLS